jgi:hypothetical protein
MFNSTKKTYACKKQIPISRPKTANTKINGIKDKTKLDIIIIKLVKICNKACPAIILANNRMDKEKVLSK